MTIRAVRIHHDDRAKAKLFSFLPSDTKPFSKAQGNHSSSGGKAYSTSTNIALSDSNLDEDIFGVGGEGFMEGLGGPGGGDQDRSAASKKATRPENEDERREEEGEPCSGKGISRIDFRGARLRCENIFARPLVTAKRASRLSQRCVCALSEAATGIILHQRLSA